MARITALYVDFQSRASYSAWRWLRQVGHGSGIEVRPYSLDTDDAVASDEPASPWDRLTPAWGLELLAIGELAREGGTASHHRFVDSAFASVHDRDEDPSSVEALLALAARADVDLERYTTDSERWRAEVGLWHREAEDELGVDRVPCLVFDHERVLHVGFTADVPRGAPSDRLLADLTDLVDQPVQVVRRTA